MPAIQASANTSQAVGAFNNLAQSILAARSALNQLGSATASVTPKTAQFGVTAQQAVSRVRGAFDTLATSIGTAFSWLERFGVGISLVFRSLLNEIDKIQGFNAIMSVTTGNSEKAAESFEFLRRTADVLGLRFDSLSSNYAKLVAAIPEGNNQLAIAERVFLGVSMAARTLHASNQDTQLMFYAVTQMASKGVVTMEELRRQLGEKLPGAIQIAAKALNTTTYELEQAIRKGLVDAVKFLPIFGDTLVGTFAKSAEIASTSVSASINRLSNVWVDFTKKVLDSGAGVAVAGIFDSIREKLSDPYVVERFAETVKEVANRLTDMVKGLSSDDLRRGFDTFTRGLHMMITLLEKVVSMLSWITNNSGTAGAAIGGIFGALQGAAIGTLVAPGVGTAVGAVAGGVIGAAGGGYAGRSLAPTFEQQQAADRADATARRIASERAAEQQRIQAQFIEPLLKVYGLNAIQVNQLFQSSRMNMATVDTLVSVLTDNNYKSQDQKRQAIIDYAQYGYLRSPSGATLDSVRPTSNKANPEQLREQERLRKQMWEGFGFQGTFTDEWSRLNKLYRDRKITVDELVDGQARLLRQQPVIRENTRAEAEALSQTASHMRKNIDYVFEMLDAIDKFEAGNQRFVDSLTEMRESVGLTGRQRYVADNLKDFDQQADELRKGAANPYDAMLINRSIERNRETRRLQLGETYDYLRSSAVGLTEAYTQFFDDLEDRGKLAASSFQSVVGSMRDAWTEFVRTGKIDIKSFVSVIQAEIAKITWARYVGPAAAGAASFITSLFGFAAGGVMSPAGPVPLRGFGSGGIAKGPMIAAYGEGDDNEAVIPLPDGRTVPVTMKSAGRSVSINIQQNITVGAGASRSEVVEASRAAKNAAVAEVRQIVRRQQGL